MELKSVRARAALVSPKFFQSAFTEGMRRYPEDDLALWVQVACEGVIVKKLSFFGDVSDLEKVLLESMASLLINKPISKLDELTIRECEAFLRDKNSEEALAGLPQKSETALKKVFQWMRTFPKANSPEAYHFASEKGPFRGLKLTDKIRELKAFLNSPEVQNLYQNLPLPELVDVEELTVYIHAPYSSERERGLFEKLHQLGVDEFQEVDLNLIPEG